MQLFQPELVRITLLGILLGTIPLVGAWSASKWMIPWAEEVSGKAEPGYKAAAQGWWAVGAVLGSFSGAQLAAKLGRRFSYGAISVGATTITLVMFRATAPQEPFFLPIVLLQGFVGTLFFGWLPLYLPELFPTQVRAVGSGLSYNIGRFATAAGVFLSGMLFSVFDGNYPLVGSVCAMIYLLGIFLTPFIPNRRELT
jgi:MFS family permease